MLGSKQFQLVLIGSTLLLLFFANSFFAQTNWQKTFVGNNLDYSRHVIAANDGNFLIVGATSSYGTGKFDVLVLKVN